jgi:hypothetical protein
MTKELRKTRLLAPGVRLSMTAIRVIHWASRNPSLSIRKMAKELHLKYHTVYKAVKSILTGQMRDDLNLIDNSAEVHDVLQRHYQLYAGRIDDILLTEGLYA